MLVAGGALITLTVTKSDNTSIAFAAAWILVLMGWCRLQFTLWTERGERRPAP